MSGIARRDEVKDMGNQLNKRMDEANHHLKDCETKIAGVKATVVNHSEQISQMRREIDNLKAKPGPQPSAAAPGPADEGWQPRISHVRGWAPFGCSATQKLNKKESMDLQAEIDKRLPDEWRHKAQWLAPFVLSHTLSMEILAASSTDAKRLADILNLS